nr:MAG TPA: hypothetical protein [Caudoviricetes sp.]
MILLQNKSQLSKKLKEGLITSQNDTAPKP